MKEFMTRKKTYVIDERGVVYDKQTMEPTKDIRIKNEHYFLAGKPLHRIIYELYKGPIPKGHSIHHYNTCPRDNRPENLIMLTNSEYGKIHVEIGRNGLEKQLKSKAVQFFYREYGAEVKMQKRVRKTKEKHSVTGSCEYHYPFKEKELKLIDAINKKLGFK